MLTRDKCSYVYMPKKDNEQAEIDKFKNNPPKNNCLSKVHRMTVYRVANN